MPLQVSAIRNYTRPLAITFAGVDDVLNIRYRAMDQDAITRHRLQRYIEIEAPPAEGSGVPDMEAKAQQYKLAHAESLVALVTEWDYLDGGKAIAITAKRLVQEPDRFLVRVLNAIQEDVAPDFLSVKPSKNGFTPEVERAD